MSRVTKDVAIVTGAGQGIGFEICKQLCQAGVAVLLNDLDTDLTKKASTQLQQAGGKCEGFAGDVSDINFINQLIDFTLMKFGKVTQVVANAGVTLYGDFFEYPEHDFNQVLKLNLGGSFFLTQAAAKQMIKQKSRWARVVDVIRDRTSSA